MPVKANWQNGEQFNASDANDVAAAVNAAYVKPGTGIPATDLASSVQVSIGKADTAIQSVASTDITDATTTGKAVLTAASGSAARTAIGVSYGTTAGTVVEGNDSRLSPSATSITDSTAVGRSVLTAVDAPAARTAIGVEYGTTSGTVAQGNDSRITGAEQAANKGQANGYASLDSGGKVPVTQLPNSIMEYQGVWDASTNTPTLDIGSGNTGDVYRVSVGGTINLGTGAITFDVGDYIIRNAAGSWEKSDTTDAVASVAGRTGNVTLTVADIGGNTSTALGVGTVELGHASDTTISRTSAGKIAVEGVDVLLSGGALGTPSSGTLTSCSGLYASTITDAGTTTLNFSSARTQVFTGATTQTVVLPSLSVPAGADYRIINNSTGAVTVQASGGGTVAVLPSGTSGVFVAAVANPTGNVLATGDWSVAPSITQTSTNTLSNKSISLASNTVTGTTAQFNAALTDNDFATLSGTETLTNKTLLYPTINGINQGGVTGVQFGFDPLKFAVVGNKHGAVFETSSTTGEWHSLYCTRTGSGGSFIGFYYGPSYAMVGNITTANNNTQTFYGTTSDYRLKKDVRNLDGCLERVLNLNPVKYTWHSGNTPGEGFIAHELQDVIPAAVDGEKDAVKADGSISPQNVDLAKVIPHLVGAIQELTARLETAEAKIAALEAAQ